MEKRPEKRKKWPLARCQEKEEEEGVKSCCCPPLVFISAFPRFFFFLLESHLSPRAFGIGGQGPVGFAIIKRPLHRLTFFQTKQKYPREKYNNLLNSLWLVVITNLCLGDDAIVSNTLFYLFWPFLSYSLSLFFPCLPLAICNRGKAPWAPL